MSHLSEILRRLNQATRVVARNHEIKRFPVTKEIPSLTESETPKGLPTLESIEAFEAAHSNS